MVGSCLQLSVWCYTTLHCPPRWKAKCGQSAQTVTPGSWQLVFNHFQLFWGIFLDWRPTFASGDLDSFGWC